MSTAEGLERPALLVLQECDTALTQLRHRSSHLPEDAEIAALEKRRSDGADRIAPTRATVSALSTRQDELETKIHDVEAKIDAASKTLYAGTVTSPRELQALEADIASLKKHRGELEDLEIEIMVEREPLDAEIAKADADDASMTAEQESLRVRALAIQAEIAVDVHNVLDRRSAIAASVATDTLALYEQIRSTNKGIAVATLEHGTCMACRLKISAVDLDRIRALPADAVARCEECGAILIR